MRADRGGFSTQTQPTPRGRILLPRICGFTAPGRPLTTRSWKPSLTYNARRRRRRSGERWWFSVKKHRRGPGRRRLEVDAELPDEAWSVSTSCCPGTGAGCIEPHARFDPAPSCVQPQLQVLGTRPAAAGDRSRRRGRVVGLQVTRAEHVVVRALLWRTPPASSKYWLSSTRSVSRSSNSGCARPPRVLVDEAGKELRAADTYFARALKYDASASNREVEVLPFTSPWFALRAVSPKSRSAGDRVDTVPQCQPGSTPRHSRSVIPAVRPRPSGTRGCACSLRGNTSSRSRPAVVAPCPTAGRWIRPHRFQFAAPEFAESEARRIASSSRRCCSALSGLAGVGHRHDDSRRPASVAAGSALQIIGSNAAQHETGKLRGTPGLHRRSGLSAPCRNRGGGGLDESGTSPPAGEAPAPNASPAAF